MGLLHRGVHLLGRVVEVASDAVRCIAAKSVRAARRAPPPSGRLSSRKGGRRATTPRTRRDASSRSTSAIYGGAIIDQRPPLGGAGLFSTADDMARFYQMMLNDGTAADVASRKHETGGADAQADRDLRMPACRGTRLLHHREDPSQWPRTPRCCRAPSDTAAPRHAQLGGSDARHRHVFMIQRAEPSES